MLQQNPRKSGTVSIGLNWISRNALRIWEKGGLTSRGRTVKLSEGPLHERAVKDRVIRLLPNWTVKPVDFWHCLFLPLNSQKAFTLFLKKSLKILIPFLLLSQF